MIDKKESMSIIHDPLIYGKNVYIGRFCIIEQNVVIGDNTIINDFSYVGENSKIGDNCKFGRYLCIGKNVLIGNNLTTSSYCEIRNDCVVGNDVSMGSRCTLSAGTIVKDKVIMKYDFVATDTPVVGAAERKTCVLESGSKFGASVVILPGVTVGENAEIGACSQVRKNVPANEIWVGNPAKYFRNSK